nr:uncharacterized protein LOC117866411 [Setaria viridis]
MLHCILVPSSLTTPVPVAAARHAGIQKEYTAASCLDSEKGGSDGGFHEPAAATKSIMTPQVWTKQCQHLNPDSDSATCAAAARLFAHCWSRSMALATSCSPWCPSLCSLSSSSTLQVLVEHDHKPTYLISKA